MRLFWFVLFQVEMVVLVIAAALGALSGFRTMNRIESKVDAMRKVIDRRDDL